MSGAEGAAAVAATPPTATGAPVAPVAAAPRPLLTPLGDPAAAACDGDTCALPA